MPPRKRSRSSAAASSAAVPPAIALGGGAAFPAAVVDLWREGALCDADVVAGGRTFRAHKLVLCAGSAYMKARLSDGAGRWADSAGALELAEMAASALDAALAFLYTGACEVPGDGALLGDVVEAAAYLRIGPLQEAAEAALVERLAPANAISMWRDADHLS